MSIFRRGGTYWYHFIHEGQHVQASTHQKNQRVARTMEAAHRTGLAKGELGLTPRKPATTLAAFIAERFEPWARASFEKSSPKTWKDWYCVQLKNILDYRPLAASKLDAITNEHVADFAASLQARELKTASINAALRVLRRVLRQSVAWGATPAVPTVKLLRGENHRERVITPDEERLYLSAAEPQLADFASVLFDTGMRPEENYRLRWGAVLWQDGTFQVTHGKTAAARRVLPMSERVRSVLVRRWEDADTPSDGWVWPANMASGHIEKSTLRKQHLKALQLSGVAPFVFYTARHTFLTRLGAAGCDAWTLARIAGHATLGISARYVHPDQTTVLRAFRQMCENKELTAGTKDEK